MATQSLICLRFTPSRVEGLERVIDVTVYPDRLEVACLSARKSIRFLDIAQWPRPSWFWRTVARFGLRRKECLMVGERDWFHSPPDRFVRFFTSPPITIYMPDEAGVNYHQTVFRRIQDLMLQGGFCTWDLG